MNTTLIASVPSRSPGGDGKFATWLIVKRILGSVLLAAALLKGHQLATLPLLPPGPFNHRELLSAVVAIEAVAGTWLLVAQDGPISWWMTMVLWLVFFGSAAYELAEDVPSCNCFGDLRVDPIYMVVGDAVVIAILAALRRTACRYWPRPRLQRLPMVVALIVAAAGGVFFWWNQSRFGPSAASVNGIRITGSGMVVLEPEKWVGRRLPVLAEVSIGAQIADGDWLVLLYRSDCDSCRRALSKLGEVRRGAGGAHLSVAAVEVPPFAEHALDLDSQVIRGGLSDARKWFVATPLAVRTRDGTVLATASGAQAERLDTFADAGRGSR